MTNEELGKLIGVGPSMASRIRNGKRLPGTNTIYRIHESLGIPVDDLVEARTKGAAELSRLIRDRLSQLAHA